MDAFWAIARMIGLIIAVILMFNVTIFVHELGHFLAAKWRGVYVDRFQVWFGKPIWKKKIGEVQCGLGWIPAGGFVSLPQMVTMESVEGKVEGDEKLPAISPADKIIVAVAGPVFSFLLAIVFAFVVWGTGKPVYQIESTTLGYVEADSPADKAGLQPGDTVTAIDGNPIKVYAGDLRFGLVENVKLSENDQITIEFERDGTPQTVVSEFEVPETKFWRRAALRQIGVSYSENLTVGRTVGGSPAESAGLKEGDIVERVNGVEILHFLTVNNLVKSSEGKPMNFEILRDGVLMNLTVTAEIPASPEDAGFRVGLGWADSGVVNETLVYPTPMQSVIDSVDMMWITITKVLAPGSHVKVEHLNGPVGIAKAKYEMLLTENGWRRVLWFMVFFNINLGLLNLLPIPILDGGHIVMATLEKLKGKPVSPDILQWVQTAFALILLSFMLFVTFKDVGDFFPGGQKAAKGELIFDAQ